MNKRKKILGVAVILILIGITISYYVANREEKKVKPNSLENKQSISDSLSPKHDSTPIDIGAKPEKNPADGSVKIVEEFIKSNSKNPATFEFLEWSEIISEDGYWKVRCKYTGVSSFNAEVTTNAWFYIRKNKVVHTKIISKI